MASVRGSSQKDRFALRNPLSCCRIRGVVFSRVRERSSRCSFELLQLIIEY